MNLKGKSILLTGEQDLWKILCQVFNKQKTKFKRLIIFSRDELKQYEMKKEFPESKYKFLRYFRRCKRL